MNTMDEKTLWAHYSSLQKDRELVLGPYYSYQFRNTPRHVIFTLSRYKFATKMIGIGKSVLEFGCNEGLGTLYLAEFSSHVTAIDFDENAIDWAGKNISSDKISFLCDNFLNKKYGEFNAVVSYDVIEHIYRQNENAYFETVLKNLKFEGIFLLGTPNSESARFSNSEIAGAHVNLYSAEKLVETAEKYFNNVFLFSQNDEMIHTGYAPMAHYLICLCCHKKNLKIQ